MLLDSTMKESCRNSSCSSKWCSLHLKMLLHFWEYRIEYFFWNLSVSSSSILFFYELSYLERCTLQN